MFPFASRSLSKKIEVNLALRIEWTGGLYNKADQASVQFSQVSPIFSKAQQRTSFWSYLFFQKGGIKKYLKNEN